MKTIECWQIVLWSSFPEVWKLTKGLQWSGVHLFRKNRKQMNLTEARRVRFVAFNSLYSWGGWTFPTRYQDYYYLLVNKTTCFSKRNIEQWARWIAPPKKSCVDRCLTYETAGITDKWRNAGFSTKGDETIVIHIKKKKEIRPPLPHTLPLP